MTKAIYVGTTKVQKMILNTVDYLIVKFSPKSLFSNGAKGFLYEPFNMSTLFQNSTGTVAVTTSGHPIGRMSDVSGNNVHALQTISSSRPIYNVNPSRTTLDKVDDSFNIVVPTGGWIGTMVVATTVGTASYEVKLPSGSYSTGMYSRYDNNIVGITFRNGSLSETEKTLTKDYFIGKGAVGSYAGVLDFTEFWYNCRDITIFPLIDTSSGTNFTYAWNYCFRLTSFPLINTSSANNFHRTWEYCTGLTSFPLINTSNVTNFYWTWRACSSLTNFPLIDTSKSVAFESTWEACESLTSFPLIDTILATTFSGAWRNCYSLTSFPPLDTSSGTNFSYAWYGCNKLTSFPIINTLKGTNFYAAWQDCISLSSFPLLNTSSATSMFGTWYNCKKLTSFPLINTSNVTDFTATWQNCEFLTSFPLIDTILATTFSGAWRNCYSLTSFPLINTISSTNFGTAWRDCSGLTSFPLINTSKGIDFSYAWYGCYRLSNIPANMFDFVKGGNFTGAFGNTSLTQVSIDNILTSLVTSGIATGTRVFYQSGGSAPSSVGISAISTLRSRGWTVTVTGGY